MLIALTLPVQVSFSANQGRLPVCRPFLFGHQVQAEESVHPHTSARSRERPSRLGDDLWLGWIHVPLRPIWIPGPPLILQI